jgi:hypothetical protein
MATMIAIAIVLFGSWDAEHACRIMTIAMTPVLIGCIMTLWCYDDWHSDGGYLFAVIPMQLSGIALTALVMSQIGQQLIAALP